MTGHRTTTEKGYGADHKRIRAAIAADMRRGAVYHCARCGEPILPDERWDLDHTDDRTSYLGPSHASGNRSAGGKKGGRLRRSRTEAQRVTRLTW